MTQSRRRIALIQGHPDAAAEHFCHALAERYARAAKDAGHRIDRIDISRIDFPLLRSAGDWQKGADGTPDSLVGAQQACTAADHLVLVYPLWLGTMPALLKAFLEQIFRPGVALSYAEGFPKPLFGKKTARVIITMGMPALAYRWFYKAHSLKNLERNILAFTGIKPVRSTLIGMVDRLSPVDCERWFRKIAKLGAAAK